MEYTINKLSQMAKISSRTLRYYDEIGLLKPKRINSSGYRIYGEEEINILQQILFYKELGVELSIIKNIINNPHFNALEALESHRQNLLIKKKQIDTLLENVNNTIAYYEGRIKMSDKEKFQGFKEELIAENDRQYGKEIREKYGDEEVEKANSVIRNMTPKQHEEISQLSEEILNSLKLALETNDPSGELAQKTAFLHAEWLKFFWNGKYTKEKHSNLAQMYVDDERFTAYYDKVGVGATKFLRDAILIFTKKDTHPN